MRAESQVPENNLNKVLAFGKPQGVSCTPMVTKGKRKGEDEQRISLRPTDEDYRLFALLRDTLAKRMPGATIDNSTVIRYSIRKVVELEGLAS